jgi:peptide/nickel transport system ATP-binding protein/oligopeptide transport system ATP-binding protein
MTSLNPVFSIGDQIAEAIMLHQNVSYDQAFKDAVALLDRVGIPSPDRRARDYPHQLSGGMRQRVMIAMAVSCRPKVLIADEPTTALDVTVQAQIFDLLNEIQRDFGAAIVLITHDMGAISEMADRVAVMYAGRVIEEASADQVLDSPQHPYARGLIDCIPALGKQETELREIPGVVPPLHMLGQGCAFKARCAHARPRCGVEKPLLHNHGAHPVACHGAEEGWV